MYAVIGDADAQAEIRERTPEKHHCRWLRKDASACDCLPPGLDGAEDKVGQVCPNNAYENYAELFINRDAFGPTLERIFRLMSEAELGVLRESDLEPENLTELITARSELEKLQRESEENRRERIEREHRMKSEAAQHPRRR